MAILESFWLPRPPLWGHDPKIGNPSSQSSIPTLGLRSWLLRGRDPHGVTTHRRVSQRPDASPGGAQLVPWGRDPQIGNPLPQSEPAKPKKKEQKKQKKKKKRNGERDVTMATDGGRSLNQKPAAPHKRITTPKKINK